MPATKYDELYDGRVACTHRSFTAKNIFVGQSISKRDKTTIQYGGDYALPLGGPATHMAARPKDMAYRPTTL